MDNAPRQRKFRSLRASRFVLIYYVVFLLFTYLVQEMTVQNGSYTERFVAKDPLWFAVEAVRLPGVWLGYLAGLGLSGAKLIPDMDKLTEYGYFNSYSSWISHHWEITPRGSMVFFSAFVLLAVAVDVLFFLISLLRRKKTL